MSLIFSIDSFYWFGVCRCRMMWGNNTPMKFWDDNVGLLCKKILRLTDLGPGKISIFSI